MVLLGAEVPALAKEGVQGLRSSGHVPSSTATYERHAKSTGHEIVTGDLGVGRRRDVVVHAYDRRWGRARMFLALVSGA